MPEWIEEHVSQSTSLGGKQACEQFMYMRFTWRIVYAGKSYELLAHSSLSS